MNCGNAILPGASGLPYYCTPPVSVSDELGPRAVWRQNTKKKRQHDEDAQSSKTGCRSPPRAHIKAYKLYIPVCPRILCIAAIWGGYFAPYGYFAPFEHRERNGPPKYLWNKSAHLNFHHFSTPFHNFGLQHQVRKPPLSNPSFPNENVPVPEVAPCRGDVHRKAKKERKNAFELHSK